MSLSAEFERLSAVIAALTVERDQLKLEVDMLNGNEEAVHVGAQAAISAIHQMDGMKRENARLRQALEDAPKPTAYPYLGDLSFLNAYERWWKSRIPEATK